MVPEKGQPSNCECDHYEQYYKYKNVGKFVTSIETEEILEFAEKVKGKLLKVALE